MAPLAVTLGDPAGIGPEIVAKAWEQRIAHDLPCFFAVGDMAAVRAVWAGPVTAVQSIEDVSAQFQQSLPVLHSNAGEIGLPGAPTAEGAAMSFHALEAAVGLTREGSASAMVTAPVSKDQLARVGFTFPGQTEYVAERCGVTSDSAVMMLAGPGLRVVPLTVHIPLSAVPTALSTELIINKAMITARGLTRNFGIAHPRIAIAGLNPHAGEQGRMGDEEAQMIQPAITALRAAGLNVTGPHPADSLFAPRQRDRFDVALCMYHDQALIPIKALHFDDGVNMTLGLPIIRTSPDHGTAFDIAGTGQADPSSMIAAIKMAALAARNRALPDATAT